MHRILIIIAVVGLTGCVSYDQTRGRSSVCEKHHVEMTKEAVRVVPGRAATDYTNTAFPHARRDIIAGCTVPETTGFVYVCQECSRLWHQSGGANGHD
jgi:hypothetical protein